MSLVDDLLPGSYKRIPFLMQSSEVTGGRKTVKQSFPNSDKQLIEDLGLAPKSFNVTVILTSNSDGEFYLRNRDKLLQKLDDGESGILVHPLYGTLENIKVTTYTISEAISSLGDGSINILFEVDNTTGIPTVIENTLSTIQNQAETSIQLLAAEIAESFSVSSSNPSNFTKAAEKISNIVTSFEDNTTFLQVAADSVNEFSNELGEMAGDVTSLVTDPVALSDSVTGLFNTVNGLYSSVEATFEVVRQFFDFGEDDVEITVDTTSKIEEAKNNAILNGNMQGQSLVLAYINASEITFSTVNQVDEVADVVEQQYQQIITNRDLTTETLNSITDLRVTIQGFFDTQKLTASQIIDIKTKVVPARVLAYQYYGSSELGADIAELNEDLNVSFLEGDLEVFTS